MFDVHCFLGAACGSPYIVFITRFRRMASRNGYIYIYKHHHHTVQVAICALVNALVL